MAGLVDIQTGDWTEAVRLAVSEMVRDKLGFFAKPGAPNAMWLLQAEQGEQLMPNCVGSSHGSRHGVRWADGRNRSDAL